MCVGMLKTINQSSFLSLYNQDARAYNINLSPQYLQNVADRQHQYGANVGDILCVDGHVDRITLATLQAKHAGVRFVNLQRQPCRPDAIDNTMSLQNILTCQCMEWRKIRYNRTVYVTTDPVLAREKREQGDLVVLADQYAFDAEVQRIFQVELLRDTAECTPLPLSARHYKSRTDQSWYKRAVKWVSGVLLILGAGWLTYVFTVQIFTVVAIFLTVFVSIMSIFRALLLFSATTADLDLNTDISAGTDNILPFKLPSISLVIPVYREENGVCAIIKALERLDYPRELLDILIVTETTDIKTRKAIKENTLPVWVREITVPYSAPQTKPKAMNYAMHFARGEIVGIYDAEDLPHPQQLRKVAEKFRASPPHVACVQARLGYYNAQECWLTRCFSIEYAIWFDVLMKGVKALGLPIPLGGTSVFFRQDVLQSIGKWDAYNVTEDADLGMRLYRKGYTTELVDCLTLEEATCRFSHWITQRSRWLKGFLQSWMTCMRTPRTSARELGWRGFIAMNLLLLGAVLSFLAQPLFWGTAIVWAVTDTVWWSGTLGKTLEYTVIIVLAGGQIVTLLSAWQALKRRQARWLFPWAFTLPFYWPLGGIAAYKAIYCLIKNPSFWAKTPHGITKFRPEPDPHTG